MAKHTKKGKGKKTVAPKGLPEKGGKSKKTKKTVPNMSKGRGSFMMKGKTVY